MAISPYIKQLRTSIGTDLILLPSVAVLPFDEEGRILLVRQRDRGTWGTIGGSVEVDEDPQVSAIREAKEEAGVEVELTGLLAVLGGPEYRITYPHGDRTAYVSTVYRARVTGGTPHPDGEETSEIGWFHPSELDSLDDLGDFARHSLRSLGLLGVGADRPRRGERPEVSHEGPQRQLTQRSPAEVWVDLLVRLRALPGVEEGHSQVSPASSRAFFLTGRPHEITAQSNLAPGGRLEPVHLHGVDDTSLHLVLPRERGAELQSLGWLEPHAYGDHGTEWFVYGPRDAGEVEVVIGLARESLEFGQTG